MALRSLGQQQLWRRHINTGSGDLGRTFIALFQPYNPDTPYNEQAGV